MTIFNETFTSDKPIYYPSNWETGKTAPQLYQQWKLTYQYFFITNILQCIVASLWIGFLWVICLGIKNSLRLYRLDDRNISKIQHRYYISQNFVFGLAFVAFIAFFLTTLFIVIDQYVRMALLKGLITTIVFVGGKWAIQKAKTAYKNYLQKKSKYQSLKKQEVQQ